MSSALDHLETGSIPPTGLKLGERERAAVERVLSSGMLAQGPEVAAFEAEFARMDLNIWVAHLTSVFRKRGYRNRAALAAHLREGRD